MRSAETSGRTVEDAVGKALAELGVSRDEVEVKVLQEPRAALLGLGGRDAHVRVQLRSSSGVVAEQIASEVLELMGYSITTDLQESHDSVRVTIEGQDLGGLIGRHGDTLDALEFLVGLHLTRRQGHKTQLMLDGEGYRARREAELTKLASQAAGRAAHEKNPVFLEPMDPRDRRTVHLALQHDPRVTTSSVGEDVERRVVVYPREPGEREPGEMDEDASLLEEAPAEE